MKMALLRCKMQIGPLNPGNVAAFPDEERDDPKRSEIRHPSIAQTHVDNKAAVRLTCQEVLGMNADGPGRKPVIHLTSKNALLHGFSQEEIDASIKRLPEPTRKKLIEMTAKELRRNAGSLLPGLSGPSITEQQLLVENMSAEERRTTAQMAADEIKRLTNLSKQLEAA